MKPTTWLPLALLSTVLAVPAAADDDRKGRGGREGIAPVSPRIPGIEVPERPSPRIPEFLLPFDADEDGRLSQEELGAAKDAIKERLADRRGNWSSRTDGERAAAREEVRARLEEQRTKHFNRAAGEDSTIDLDEIFAIGAFSKLAERSPERAAAIFSRLDADSDGGITLDEFMGNLRPVRPKHADKPEDRERPTRSRDRGE